MNIAIIPARIGSKRIKKKNIKKFFGYPLIFYPIKLAKKSNLFDKIIVSTDDNEIANISKSYGAEIPFLRPKNLSDDYTPTLPVISHSIEQCLKLKYKFDNVCCIYPTALFLSVEDLKLSFSLFKKNKNKFCFPVAEFPSSVHRSFFLDKKNKVTLFNPKNEFKRTQDLEPLFYDCGQFYWGAKNKWLNSKKIHSEGVGYVIPSWRVIDLDTQDDWKRAEILKKILKI